MEMARIQLDLQMGQEPNRERVKELAGELDKSYSQWQGLVTKLRHSQDFQSLEYYKLVEAHLGRSNKSMSVERVGNLVKYQVDCMKAFADGRPPLPPPPGLDLGDPSMANAPSAAAMSPAYITAEPFSGKEALFASDVVREEYEALRRDHRQLIKMGEGYGSFDPLGKAAFIDQVEAIQERWDIFYARCSLQGGLNPTFREQCDAYLQSLGLGPGEFRKILAAAHASLRSDADAERGLPGA